MWRFLLLFFMVPGLVLAQKNADSTRSVGVGVGVGGVAYRGDLNSTFDTYSLEGSAQVVFNVSAFFSPTLMAYVGTVSGQNPDLAPVTLANGQRVLLPKYFRTTYQGVAFLPRFRLLHRGAFQLHVAQGIGLYRFVPRTAEGERWLDQIDSRLPIETYGTAAIHLPTQIQVSYWWSETLQWQVQGSLFNPITDYTDNVGELGSLNGNDNLLAIRFLMLYAWR